MKASLRCAGAWRSARSRGAAYAAGAACCAGGVVRAAHAANCASSDSAAPRTAAARCPGAVAPSWARPHPAVLPAGTRPPPPPPAGGLVSAVRLRHSGLGSRRLLSLWALAWLGLGLGLGFGLELGSGLVEGDALLRLPLVWVS